MQIRNFKLCEWKWIFYIFFSFLFPFIRGSFNFLRVFHHKVYCCEMHGIVLAGCCCCSTLHLLPVWMSCWNEKSFSLLQYIAYRAERKEHECNLLLACFNLWCEFNGARYLLQMALHIFSLVYFLGKWVHFSFKLIFSSTLK